MSEMSRVKRRQFLAGVASAGIMTCLPAWGRESVSHTTTNKKVLIDILISQTRESNREYDMETSRDEIDGIIYAVETIAPMTHNELALVINWSRGMRFKPLVDEYVNRKGGRKSDLPFHPVFRLEEYAMPETYGILAYKEQIESLFFELFTCTSTDCRQLYYKLLQSSIPRESHRFDMNVFWDLLSEKYRKSLSIGEADTIYAALQIYGYLTTTYMSCSVAADKVYAEMKEKI